MRQNVPFLLIVFLTLSISVLATDLNITVNADAEITATSSLGTSTSTSVTGGTQAVFTFPYEGNGQYTFTIIPTDSKYLDTTFTQTISEWWNADVTIALSAAPLPEDSAYLPIRTNVPATLTATAQSVISGSVPTGSFTFKLAGKSNDTIVLPVISDGTTAISGIAQTKEQSVRHFFHNNTHMLALPTTFQNGKIFVVSAAGRIIASKELTSIQNDLSVWNVGTGIYFVRITDQNGSGITEKIAHSGGDFKLSSSFSNQFYTGGIMNTTKTALITRASTASYLFEIEADDSKYRSISETIELVGQMNPAKSFYLVDPNDTGSQFDQLLDSVSYEEMFPNRFGLGYGAYINDPLPDDPSLISKLQSDGDYDFYTYSAFASAIDNMSEIEVDIYIVEGHNYMHRLVWRNKKTGVSRDMVNNVEYNNYKATGTEILFGSVDYGTFCNDGDIATKKQELAAFLGNISHETTGAGADDAGKDWGLYWREEVAWQNGSTALGYVDQYPNDLYPPTGGQSYHGRGPIQITHNVNYGQLSEFLYGDKQILLDDPGKLVPDNPEDGTVAFMSAIWFWMTPQAPKPSCHDVMVGNWIPDADDIAAKRDQSKFGMTINIINGGLECGRATDHRVEDRIGFYKRYIQILGETPEDYCECSEMGYY